MATWIFGCLYLVGFIFSLCVGMWWQASIEGLVLLPFVLSVIDQHKVLYRKIIHIVYLIGTIISAILGVVAIIVVAVNPSELQHQITDQCWD